MIEGLRLLLWVHEAERRNNWSVPSDCEKCMETVSKTIRQTMGCAYEAPAPVGLRVDLPRPIPPDSDLKITTCPGYTTRLPEVIEVARARLHWSKGGPAGIGINNWAESPLCAAIEVLEGASNEVQSWAMDNPIKKRGS